MSDSIGILCRGQSMALAEKDFKELDEIIIVNTFFKEIEMPFVQEILKNKKVTHMCCRETASILTKDLYKKFNIENIILNVYQPEFKHISIVRKILHSQGLQSKPIPDLMKKYEQKGGGFPTTGILSVVYACKVLEKKNIHIAGMDFYKSPYLIHQKPTIHQIRKGERMVNYIKDFIKESQGTNFYFSSNFNLNLSCKNYYHQAGDV